MAFQQGPPLRYAIAMSFVGRPKDQMLPYIKSMQAAAKLANNTDLLMVMMKSDSKHMTATWPEFETCNPGRKSK